MRVGMWIFALIVLLIASSVKAEITFWKLGGSGLEWSANDTTRLFIDFTSVPRAIQPIYLTPEETVFSHLEQWAHWRTPDDRILEFVEGERVELGAVQAAGAALRTIGIARGRARLLSTR